MSDRRRGWLLVLVQAGLLAVLVVGPRGEAWSVGGPGRSIGAALRMVGIAAIVLGIVRLGRRARVHPAPGAAAVLRTDGPYRFVRHPIYSGVLVWAAGTALGTASLLGVAAFAALTVTLNAKARLEERLLVQRFPDYADYARRTPRFVPFPRSR